jgi:hypothetical protein
VRNRSFEEKIAYLKQKNGVATHPITEQIADKHYSVREVASLLNLSDDKVRRLFQDEPGVLVIGDQSRKSKRRYTTLRIPESVLERVLRRFSNV